MFGTQGFNTSPQGGALTPFLSGTNAPSYAPAATTSAAPNVTAPAVGAPNFGAPVQPLQPQGFGARPFDPDNDGSRMGFQLPQQVPPWLSGFLSNIHSRGGFYPFAGGYQFGRGGYGFNPQAFNTLMQSFRPAGSLY